jgi:hypothetical protein
LLKDPEVHAMLQTILENGREGFYRETYRKLVERKTAQADEE